MYGRAQHRGGRRNHHQAWRRRAVAGPGGGGCTRGGEADACRLAQTAAARCLARTALRRRAVGSGPRYQIL